MINARLKTFKAGDPWLKRSVEILRKKLNSNSYTILYPTEKFTNALKNEFAIDEDARVDGPLQCLILELDIDHSPDCKLFEVFIVNMLEKINYVDFYRLYSYSSFRNIASQIYLENDYKKTLNSTIYSSRYNDRLNRIFLLFDNDLFDECLLPVKNITVYSKASNTCIIFDSKDYKKIPYLKCKLNQLSQWIRNS